MVFGDDFVVELFSVEIRYSQFSCLNNNTLWNRHLSFRVNWRELWSVGNLSGDFLDNVKAIISYYIRMEENDPLKWIYLIIQIKYFKV